MESWSHGVTGLGWHSVVLVGEKRGEIRREADNRSGKGGWIRIRVKDCKTEFLQKGTVCCAPSLSRRLFFNPPRK